jgi:hypothetical protein
MEVKDKTQVYTSLLKKSSYEYYSKWDKWVPADPVTLEEVSSLYIYMYIH